MAQVDSEIMETEPVGNSDTSQHTEVAVQLNKPCDTVHKMFSTASVLLLK